LKTTLRKTDK